MQSTTTLFVAVTLSLALLSPSYVLGIVGEANVAISTPAGDFTPSTAVTPQLEVSQTVSSIIEELSTNHFTAARQIYENSGTLKELALGEGLSGPVFEQAKAFYGGEADFNHEYLVQEAFMATGGNAEVAEMVEKTVMDAVPVQGILSYAYNGGVNNLNRADWDKACALYIGQPSLGSSPYERAQKRGANYGTMEDGVAQANLKILEACASGPSQENYATVLRNIKVTYAQGTIRYAFFLDNAFVEGLSTVDNRAEGQAFYRIIAPMLEAADPFCHNVVDELYNFDKQPNMNIKYYCEAVACVPAALGLSGSEMGVLEDTKGHCDGVSDKPSTPPKPLKPYDDLQSPTTPPQPLTPCPTLADNSTTETEDSSAHPAVATSRRFLGRLVLSAAAFALLI